MKQTALQVNSTCNESYDGLLAWGMDFHYVLPTLIKIVIGRFFKSNAIMHYQMMMVFKFENKLKIWLVALPFPERNWFSELIRFINKTWAKHGHL